MADGEDTDVDGDILHPIEKEDDAQQEQNMVISRHHVFGAKVDEGDDMYPPYFLDIARVTGGDVMGKGLRSAQRKGREGE